MDLSGYVEGMINFEGGGGGESFVPRPTPTDRNKYLGVKSDSNDLEYRSIREVPSTDDVAVGNVLTRVASGVEWSTIEKELPPFNNEDNGKVLGIVNGRLAWVTQSGGNVSLEATVLYDTPITSNGTYTLANSYENYDFISIKAGNGTNECDIHTYTVDDIKRAMNESKVITNPNTAGWFNFTMSTNTITIPNKSINTIYSVIGYKIVQGQ